MLIKSLYYQIQRYKFESNSQLRLKGIMPIAVVLSNTKIQIWKQFTTDVCWLEGYRMLYYQIQRYKFESNSQLLASTPHGAMRCIIKYKDTNLKAIHNSRACSQLERCVVLSNTKIQIWKQFTTLNGNVVLCHQLYYQIQRYKFESNSQQTRIAHESYSVVLSNTKIQIWKQFTTGLLFGMTETELYYQIQRYKFESNSQLLIILVMCFKCCIIKYKDTNLKAIHNIPLSVVILNELYYQIQRYKFESNSQLIAPSSCLVIRCIIKYKDTNLKAIHNYIY